MTDDELATLTALRHQLHQRPETRFAVADTAAVLTDHLDAAGLEVTTGVGGSGVVATLRRGSSSRSIGLRADIDALPIQERGDPPYASQHDAAHHGCGHDGHATMLVGAARALADDRHLDGTVHLLFQPSEEDGRGAQAMIEDGLFERFPMDAVFGLHNLPGLPVGHLATRDGHFTAFEEVFEITITGSGGHASAPHAAVDPLVAGAEMVLALQTIVSRAVPPGAHAVVSVTELVTDGARNVIPTTVRIRGDTRGYDDGVSTVIRDRMERLVQGVAAAHGATATLSYEREFWPVVNTAAETRMPLADWQRLRDIVTGVGFVDATPVLAEVRSCKSPAEIAKIRHVYHLAGDTFDALPDIASEGVALSTVFRRFHLDLLERGADRVPYLVSAAGPGGYPDVISPPTDEPLRAGDVLMLDTGAVHDGYFCDFDRNVAIGHADAAAARAYDTLHRAVDAGLRVTRPGARCSELFAAMAQVIEEDRYAAGNIGRFGHGLGIQLTEWPSHTHTDHTVLRDGMVITLEPALTIAPGRTMVHEENVLVVADGAELLTRRAPAELPVI